MVGAAVDHAGRTGVDESRNARLQARSDNVFGSPHIGLLEIADSAPEAGFRSDMKDQFASLNCLPHRVGVGDVTPTNFDPPRGKVRIGSARKNPHAVSALGEPRDDRTAQKTSSACDQDPHEICSPAHTASRSRKIFALCRISTGNWG